MVTITFTDKEYDKLWNTLLTCEDEGPRSDELKALFDKVDAADPAPKIVDKEQMI